MFNASHEYLNKLPRKREKNAIIERLLQTKHVDLKPNETTDNQPINNVNVILHKLDETNLRGKDLSKTLINFDESICDEKLHSPASQKMLDKNDIDNSDKKNIKNDINLGNNDINAKNNKVNSNPSSYNVVSYNTLNNQHLSSTNPFSSPALHNNSNITHRNQKKLI